MSKVIGIDLGTTNSAVAVMEGGESVIVPNSEGNRTTPSIVAFTKDGERLVGETAKRQAITNPDRTITSIKREMGTEYKVNIDGKDYSPEEISAMILQKLKADTESYLGEEVTEAVITVPAYFTDSQRQATKNAGKIAGLNVKRIINEPTAAALAYGIDKEADQHKVMVYDLGGGTFDVSILEVGDGVFEVLATRGNNRLGGDDFDEKLLNYLADEFMKQNGVDLRKDATSKQRLKDAAENAKKELSTRVSTNVNLPFISAVNGTPVHLNMDITRSKFDELTSDLVEESLKPVRQALEDAGLSHNDIEKVLLVGGSTRIPAVQEAVKKLIGKNPQKDINPDECVAIGAALQGGVLTGEVKDLLLLDVTPLSLGIETLGGVCTNLTEIPAAPRGVPQIEVTFDIDANGIVNVSAKDLGSGKQQAMTITSSTKMSDEEIKRKVDEASKYAEEDKNKKETIETKNNAESVIYQVEKTIKDLGDKVSESEKSDINSKVEALKSILDSGDNNDIKAKTDELTQEMYKLSSKLYENTAQQPGASQESKKDDDVVDADYEVVDDDENK